MPVHHTTDSAFDTDVLKSDIPVLLDFWAPWCGPCVALSPTLDELSIAFEGRVKIVKMNVDEPDNAMTPAKYGVRGIPMLLLFKDGKVVSSKVGAVPKAGLITWIQDTLK